MPKSSKSGGDDQLSAKKTNLPLHLQTLIDLLPLNEPIHQSQIFEAYGRKPEYARRIRKIVSEYGWHIERIRGKNGANEDYYIRRSEGPVRIAHIRKEVNPRHRQEIYNRDDWTCALCSGDVSTSQNITAAQCDHKIPAERGGLSVSSNLQTLCLRCNLKKRQACKYCLLPSCDNCPYAFPEKYGEQIVIGLSKAALAVLQKLQKTRGLPPNQIIEEMLLRSV